MRCVLVFHIALLAVSFPSIAQCQDALIQDTCHRTPHYDLCLSTLTSSPASSRADLRGLARVAVSAVLAKATENLELIRALLRQQEPDPGVEKSLALCAELYIPVVKYSLPQAIEALVGGHFGFASYGIADVAKQADACDKGFGGDSSPVANQNAVLSDLSEVANAIISCLQD